LKQNRLLSEVLPVLLFTLLGFAVMGYHPGYEDDGIYLAAVHSELHPGLYAHDAAFFKMQMQASAFDSAAAEFIRITHIPVAWTELLGQLLAIFLILWACQSIAGRFFERAEVRWAGVAMMAAMLTLPVAGTALYIADQHLHPRNLATAFILLATDRILAGRRWHAVPLLVAAVVMHPIMAAFGFSFCFCLAVALMEPVHVWLRDMRAALARGAAVAVPIGWIFETPNAAWRKALSTRHYYLLSGWHWYEWLGAVGPLLLFWGLMRLAKKRGDMLLSRFAFAVLVYGLLQQAVALVMLTPASLIRLSPLQPMRYLQIVYCFMVLLGGCLIGQFLLKGRAWRWVIFLVAANGAMLSAQEAEFTQSPHLEMPWTKPANPWLQAFGWIRQNTPKDAYFALDPNYLALPGEDYHNFRALAERSQLADGIKDTAVVVLVPQLAPEWNREVEAEAGWNQFKLADFERLKQEFGVGWVLVSYPPPAGLDCRWRNEALSVCQVP
jgi:hypothetical protein